MLTSNLVEGVTPCVTVWRLSVATAWQH